LDFSETVRIESPEIAFYFRVFIKCGKNMIYALFLLTIVDYAHKVLIYINTNPPIALSNLKKSDTLNGKLVYKRAIQSSSK